MGAEWLKINSKKVFAFLDISVAFDSVKHKKLFKIIE